MSTPPLVIESYTLTRSGDTASVIHLDTDEAHTHYLFTETWQRLDGEWRLRILHISNVLGDPPTVTLTHSADRRADRHLPLRLQNSHHPP